MWYYWQWFTKYLWDEDIEIHNGFCWLSLGQIRKLLYCENLVNMDARSVLSCFSFLKDRSRTYFESCRESNNIGIEESMLEGFAKDVFVSTLAGQKGCNSEDEIISRITELKTKYTLDAKKIPLKDVSKWERTANEIIQPKADGLENPAAHDDAQIVHGIGHHRVG